MWTTSFVQVGKRSYQADVRVDWQTKKYWPVQNAIICNNWLAQRKLSSFTGPCWHTLKYLKYTSNSFYLPFLNGKTGWSLGHKLGHKWQEKDNTCQQKTWLWLAKTMTTGCALWSAIFKEFEPQLLKAWHAPHSSRRRWCMNTMMTNSNHQWLKILTLGISNSTSEHPDIFTFHKFSSYRELTRQCDRHYLNSTSCLHSATDDANRRRFFILEIYFNFHSQNQYQWNLPQPRNGLILLFTANSQQKFTQTPQWWGTTL